MASKPSPIQPPRSRKAGQPREGPAMVPRALRRTPSAHGTRKGTTLDEAGDTRARWPAAKPKFKKGS